MSTPAPSVEGPDPVDDLAPAGRGVDDVRRALRYLYSSWGLVVLIGGPGFSTGAETRTNELSLVVSVAFAAAAVYVGRTAPRRVRRPVWAVVGLGLVAPLASLAAFWWADRHQGVDLGVHPLAFAALGVFGLAASRWFRGEGFGRAPALWRRTAVASLVAHLVYAVHLMATVLDLHALVVWALSAVVAGWLLAAIAWAAMAADATRHGLLRAEWLVHRTAANG